MTQASRREQLVLLLAGDVMTGRGVDQAMRHPVDPVLYEAAVRDARVYLRLAEAAHGAVPRPVAPAYPWGAALAAAESRAPDLRIVNLETAVTTSTTPWPGKGIHYRMHPDHTDCLQAAKVDACTLANNHVVDWGPDGLTQTLGSLQAAGVQTAGAGADADRALAPACWPMPDRLRMERDLQGCPPRAGQAAGEGLVAGVARPQTPARVLLFSLAEPGCGVPDGWKATAAHAGVALLPDLTASTARQTARHITGLRNANDVVIVSLHWGGNWGLDIPRAHRDFARRLIDAGAADLVHGHSSHHPMPLEIHEGRLVLYGCGDLINDYEGIVRHGRDGLEGALPGDIGCLYFAHLDPGSGALVRLEIVPFERRRLQLVPAGAEARRWMITRVLQASTRRGWAWVDEGGQDRAWVWEPSAAPHAQLPSA